VFILGRLGETVKLLLFTPKMAKCIDVTHKYLLILLFLANSFVRY